MPQLVPKRKLINYPDSKCVYGYMTLCEECKPKAPAHVDIAHPIMDFMPSDRCEICGKRGQLDFIAGPYGVPSIWRS